MVQIVINSKQVINICELCGYVSCSILRCANKINYSVFCYTLVHMCAVTLTFSPNSIVHYGEKVSISCDLNGEHDNSGVLHSGEDSLDSDTYKVQVVSFNDIGRYTCRSTEAGIFSDPQYLSVSGMPHITFFSSNFVFP